MTNEIALILLTFHLTVSLILTTIIVRKRVEQDIKDTPIYIWIPFAIFSFILITLLVPGDLHWIGRVIIYR